MNVNSFLSPRALAGAAIVGLVSAAGMYIYEQVYAEKRRSMLVQEVQRLDRQVCCMRSELEAIRELQKETFLRRLKPRKPRKREPKPTVVAGGDAVDGRDHSNFSDSENNTDYQSIVGTDAEMDSEEFYDVPTDEDSDDTLRENGHVRHIDAFPDDDFDKKGSPKLTPRNET